MSGPHRMGRATMDAGDDGNASKAMSFQALKLGRATGGLNGSNNSAPGNTNAKTNLANVNASAPRYPPAAHVEPEDSDESSLHKYEAEHRGSTFYGSHDSYESSQPSYAASSKSSAHQSQYETPNITPGMTPGASAAVSREYFEPRKAPERRITPPDGSLAVPQPPAKAARSPSASSHSGDEQEEADRITAAPPPGAAYVPQSAHNEPAGNKVDATQGEENAADVAATSKAAPDMKMLKRAKMKLTFQKYVATFALICINALFIFACWYWPQYYFVYLPFISFPLVLNCIMIASLICFKLRNIATPEKQIEPDHLETMAMIMPCYNETFEECTRSLDSLVNQVGIEEHKRGIMVVCDGRVRGPGMAKTTAAYLMEDIFVERTHHEKIRNAYRGWDGASMDIEVTRGYYKGVPYYCIVKEQNQGKRDSLIVVRSFLYKFNMRHSNQDMVFSPYFFQSMSSWLTEDVAVDSIDHLVGMDADTVFDDDCIAQLLKESKYPNTVGVCGYVAVDFSSGNWNLWSLYQHAEYTIAQGLRRLHQSMVTKKVSCLPGCCQLLKICDYTCGDQVLVDLFGYHPAPMDGMIKQIRATASEDRNHVCLMLTTHPKAQTRQALRARALTDVPHSWSVFLSQRRRWSLGATSNDLLLFSSWHCQWFERILALCNVMVWTLSVFIVSAIGAMIVAFMHQPWWIILAFASIMIIPLCYYVLITVWLPRTMRERAQYLAGLCLFTVCGPFLNLIVLLFSIRNMDSFGWGKTRLVVADDDDEKKQAATSTDDSSAQEDSASNGRDDSAGQAGSKDMNENSRYDEEANVGVLQPTHTPPGGRR